MNAIVSKLLLGAAVFSLSPMLLQAQDFPAQPIQLIVPFAAGGSIDILARLIAPGLSEQLGQPVVVENRAGASGNVGAEYVLRQQADGYTLLMHGLPFATQPFLDADMPFEPLEVFDPLTVVAIQPNIMVVNPDLGVETVEELIAYALENPGEINFASSGVGAGQHIAAQMFMDLTGTELVHVPYQGGGPAMVDLIGGRVQMMIETAPSAMRYVTSGELTALGVTTTTRLATLPDVPTIAESGLPEYELAGWIILATKAGTPEPVVERIYEAVETVLADETIQLRLGELGLIGDGRPPAEARTFLEGESDLYGQIITAIGVTAD